MGRGFNLPPLTKVYILFPFKLTKTLEQIVGRVKRFLVDKKSYVYLWSDSSLRYQFETKDERLNKTRIKQFIKDEYNKEVIKI